MRMNRQSKEEQSRDTKPDEKSRKEGYFWHEGMPRCCEAMARNRSAHMPGLMARCCEPTRRACRWCPLILIVLAGAAFLLGCYLSPSAVRVTWLLVSGTVVLAATLGLLLARLMCRARARR